MKINTSFMAAAVATVGLMAASAASAATVAKDNAASELRAPTAQEAQVLSQSTGGKTALKAAPRGLRTGTLNPQPVKHADGTIEQELDESSLSYSVASRNADGSIDLHCVTGAEAADALLKGKKTAAKSGKAAMKGHSHDSK